MICVFEIQIFESCNLSMLLKHFKAHAKSLWPFTIFEKKNVQENDLSLFVCEIQSTWKLTSCQMIRRNKIVSISLEPVALYLCTWLAWDSTYLSCGVSFRKLNPEAKILCRINQWIQCTSVCIRPKPPSLFVESFNVEREEFMPLNCIPIQLYWHCPRSSWRVDSQKKPVAQSSEEEKNGIALEITGSEHMLGISITNWLCFIDMKWPIVIPKSAHQCILFA